MERVDARIVPSVGSVQQRKHRAAAVRSFRCAWSSEASVLLFFSQSRTAVSRTEDTDTLRRCASRSRSDLSSSDKRQLYTSVFMHYIVVQNCITCNTIP